MLESTADLIRLLAMGVSLDLRHAELTPDEMIEIAAAAKASKGIVVLPGRRPMADLLRVAEAGGACVVLCWPDRAPSGVDAT